MAKISPTLLGIASLIFWSLGATLMSFVCDLPRAQVLGIVFCIGGFITVIRIIMRKSQHELKQPLAVWLFSIVGIIGNTYCLILAFTLIPIATADLINYLWPVIFIMLSTFLPGESFSLKHVVGCALGLLGLTLLMTDCEQLTFTNREIFGCLIAFCAAVCWGIYSVSLRLYKHISSTVTGATCLMSGLIMLAFQSTFYELVIPTTVQWIILLIMGLTSHGIAFLFWDIGIKKGDFKTLSIFSYCMPILSIFFLVLFGVTESSDSLWYATLLITLAGLIPHTNVTSGFSVMIPEKLANSK